MHLFKLTDEQITQLLIPKRFVPPTPQEHEGKNMVYVFDSEDKFERKRPLNPTFSNSLIPR